MAKELLTDVTLRSSKPTDKDKRLNDGGGLYLLLKPNGAKWWRFDYSYAGKRKTLSLGTYPDTTLANARKKAGDARNNIANGIDPSDQRKEAKAAQQLENENTKRMEAGLPAIDSFEEIAREWHSKFKAKWTPDHASRLLTRLEKDVFPHIGSRPINEIDAPELLRVMQRIEARGVIDTLHRALQNCGQIFRYGVATGRCQRDPSGDLRGALTPVKSKHHASITDPKQIGDLLRAMEDYQGSLVSQCALKFSALTFCRPGEIRHAEWAEIDFETKQWRIPGPKMKMRLQHIVPLAGQTIALLEKLHQLTGDGKYLFPSERSKDRPMSENTVNAAIRRMGYSKNEMTAHGFRSMASTRLNELHFNRDWIERQLAHSEKDGVRAAYNHAEYLPQRTNMMQAWADYLDGLKAGAEVIPFRRQAN